MPVAWFRTRPSVSVQRLFFLGGLFFSKENRHTPVVEHWSLKVKDGKPLENEWRTEVPIPRGGPHRPCIIVNDQLYVIGGQEGDFQPKPGSPIFKCSRRNEYGRTHGDSHLCINLGIICLPSGQN